MDSHRFEHSLKKGCRCSLKSLVLSYHRRGFTVVELMVTIAIAAMLTSILMPGLRAARESANRIQCSSNLRQIGIAMHVYALYNGERLPSTIFDNSDTHMPQEMMALTTGTMADPATSYQWDGLGLLVGDPSRYLDDPHTVYCPCHHGNHDFGVYQDKIKKESLERVYGNYHFIGDDDRETGRHRFQYDLSSETVLVVDGMREESDLNHVDGTNTLRGDASVRWWHDGNLRLRHAFTETTTDNPPPPLTYQELWKFFARPVQ